MCGARQYMTILGCKNMCPFQLWNSPFPQIAVTHSPTESSLREREGEREIERERKQAMGRDMEGKRETGRDTSTCVLKVLNVSAVQVWLEV